MKKLRDLYNKDPAAKKFLEEHPEFNDRFLEQEEQYAPGFNTQKGRYTLHELSEQQREYGELMANAINAYPQNTNQKALLEAYFAGTSLKALQKLFKIPTANSLRVRIHRAKKTILKAYFKSRKIQIKGKTPQAIRSFSLNGESRTIYLISDEVTKDFIWVKEDGTVLSDDVQRILDEDPDYKEWDVIYL